MKKFLVLLLVIGISACASIVPMKGTHDAVLGTVMLRGAQQFPIQDNLIIRVHLLSADNDSCEVSYQVIEQLGKMSTLKKQKGKWIIEANTRTPISGNNAPEGLSLFCKVTGGVDEPVVRVYRESQ